MNTPPIVLGKVSSRILAALSLLLGSCLVAIAVMLLNASGPSVDVETGIVTFPISFAAFFLFLAWRFWQSPQQQALGEESHWRRLAIFMFVLALAGIVLWHWIAALFPAIIGILCLMKHRAIGDRIASFIARFP